MKKLINGEMKTKEEVVLENMQLVRKVCHRLYPKAKRKGIEFEDMESLGVIGLIRAYDHFEQVGVQFSTYAYPKIFSEIQRCMEMHATGPRFSVNVVHVAESIQKHELQDLSDEEIKHQFQIGDVRIKLVREYLALKPTASLDEPLVRKNRKSEPYQLIELIGSNQDFTSMHVQEFLAQLNEREKVVVQGLLTKNTLVEISRTLGVSPPSVRRYRRQIQEKLETYLMA